MRLRYTKRAARQIDKALDYVSERSPQGAARVQERLVAVLTLGVTALPESKRRRQLQLWVVDTLRPWFAGRILPVNDHIAKRWGILAGECRRSGRQLTMADGLIAATAREHNLTVVTRNVRDFADSGVDLLNPWAVTPPDMPKTQ